MIRDFQLFCKLNTIKISELQLFKQTIDSFCPDNTTCIFCGAIGALEAHGYYTRYFILLAGDEILIESLPVPRYKCDCGRTHSLLPAHLIPYSSYSLFFILTVLRAYSLHLKTVAVLCDRYGIATSTLYAWIHLYNQHKALWLGILKNLESSNISFLYYLFGADNFLLHFFSQMSFSFLQGMSKATPSHRTDRFADP